MSRLDFTTASDDQGARLDRFLAEKLPDESRTRIQQWIRDGRVWVDGETARSSLRLEPGQRIAVEPAPAPALKAAPENIPLDVLYEDEHLAAINKPAGMTVHAGAGEAARSGTLVNALLHRFGSLSGVGGELRPGIVHRLDRFTSGVVLVAKSDAAHRALARLFESRQVRKIYWAIVHGEVRDPKGAPPAKGRVVESEGRWQVRIEQPIGRDPRRRARMAVTAAGRRAVTDYRPLSTTGGFSLLEARIHTGRTHQIRVHLAWAGRPVVGDRLYGAPATVEGLPALDRYYLHARELGLTHPFSGQLLSLIAPPPPEFEEALRRLAL